MTPKLNLEKQISAQEAMEMVGAFRQLVAASRTTNPIAQSELNPDSLLAWIMEREAFDFRASVQGSAGGFLDLDVFGSRFKFGIFFHLTEDRSFAAFIASDPVSEASLRAIEDLIDGGSIMMDRATISRWSMPPFVDEVLRNGGGYPLRL